MTDMTEVLILFPVLNTHSSTQQQRESEFSSTTPDTLAISRGWYPSNPGQHNYHSSRGAFTFAHGEAIFIFMAPFTNTARLSLKATEIAAFR